MSDLLGGKGANLAEMVGLGIPVPDGFTITTDACRSFLNSGELSAALLEQVDLAIIDLQSKTGKSFGSRENPLLVSVRSGAKYSMPGMMETVLNVGISEEVATTLELITGDSRFAWDSYRRFVEMFGKIVCDVPGEEFSKATYHHLLRESVSSISELSGQVLRKLGSDFVSVVENHTKKPFPWQPKEQLRLTIEAVFQSWNSDRAQLYRRRERISSELGTAVNVQDRKSVV